MNKNIIKSLILSVITVLMCLAISPYVHAVVNDDQPITDERWVISEIYEADSGNKYVEFYNNSTNDGLGWGDYFINLPVNSDLLELMEVFGFQHIKQHAFKVIDLGDSWYSTLAFNLLKAYGLDSSAFTEISDALEEEDDYSYQRCLYYKDGRPLLSNKFYYGKKTKGKEINCSNSSVRPINLMGRTGVCKGLRLNEIQSYAENDEQFIELYNASSQPIDLGSCYVAKSQDDADKAYAMDHETLKPGEFYTQYLNDDDGVGLKLNERSGKVVLFDGDRRTEVDKESYSGMREDTSWALGGDDNWHMTYTVTPGEPNEIDELKPCEEEGYERNPKTNRCTKSVESTDSSKWLATLLGLSTDESSPSSTLTPCKEGYYRNPETNRCKKITSSSSGSSDSDTSSLASSSTLTPCKEGYYRNPETNRCKKIESTSSTSTTSSSSLSPCPTGYYRNPETNRCKKLATTSSSTLTPCKEGYERNPATNRCVKKTTTNKTSELTPCKEGYERNPKTNRCRKKTNADDDAKYPVNTTDKKNGTDDKNKRSQLTLIIALVAGGLLCLAVIIWQYREAIRQHLNKVFGRSDNVIHLDGTSDSHAGTNSRTKNQIEMSKGNSDNDDSADPAPIEFK